MIPQLIVLIKDQLWKLGSLPLIGPFLKFLYSLSLIVRNHKLFSDLILSYPRFTQESMRRMTEIENNLRDLGAKARRAEYSLFQREILQDGVIVSWPKMESFALQTYSLQADEFISASLLQKGVWDYPLSNYLLESFRNRKAVFIDAGANIGYFSLLAHRLLRSDSNILAFEPEPQNFEILKRNIQLNSANNIHPSRLALSDKAGSAQLSLSNSNLGDHRLEGPENRKSITVQTATLDEISNAQNFPFCDLVIVKADIQGSEGFLLRGMQKAAQRWNHFSVILEVTPRFLNDQRFSFDEFTNLCFCLSENVRLLSARGLWQSPENLSQNDLKDILSDSFYAAGGDFTIELIK